MNTQPFGQTWPAWTNGWVFVYEISGSGFESSCSHLNFTLSRGIENAVPVDFTVDDDFDILAMQV